MTKKSKETKAVKKLKKETKKLKKVAKATKNAAKVLTGSGAYRAAVPAPTQHILSGRGDYIDNIAKAGAGILGTGLRKGIGYLGDIASGLFGNLIGDGDYMWGSYKPKENSLLGQDGVPAVMATGPKSTIIEHRETLCTINSSNAFQLVSFNLNCGLPSTFPWGNTPASAYQRWRCLGAVLCYVPNVDAYGGGNINGKVCLSARYDMNDPAPINMIEMENCQFSVAGRPAQPLLMAVECARDTTAVNFLNVRTGSLPSGFPLQFYDHCILDIANSGQVDGTTMLGTIYISYQIELMMPIDLAVVGSLTLSDKFQCSGCVSATPFGTTQTQVSTSTIGGTMTGVKYTFPSYVQSGNWLFLANFQGGSATTTTPTFTTSGCTKITMFATTAGFDNTSVMSGVAAGIASVAQAYVVVVTVGAANATITIGNVTLAGTTYADVVCTPINANIVTLSREKRMFENEWKRLDEEKKREDAFVTETVHVEIERALKALGYSVKSNQSSLRPPPCCVLGPVEEKIGQLIASGSSAPPPPPGPSGPSVLERMAKLFPPGVGIVAPPIVVARDPDEKEEPPSKDAPRIVGPGRDDYVVVPQPCMCDGQQIEPGLLDYYRHALKLGVEQGIGPVMCRALLDTVNYPFTWDKFADVLDLPSTLCTDPFIHIEDVPNNPSTAR